MASTTLNITETITPFDEVDESVSPIRTVVDVEDTVNVSEAITDVLAQRTIIVEEDAIVISETVSETHTERFIRNLDDEVSVQETLVATEQHNFVIPVEESISISETVSETHTIRTIINVEDGIGVNDEDDASANDRTIKSVPETIILLDTVTTVQTQRFERSTEEVPINVSDIAIQEYGIKIESVTGGRGFVDGSSFGSFQAGASASLSVALNPNFVFYKWSFSKSGIVNIFDPNSTIIIPSGGGSITPILIDMGAIVLDFNSVVLVSDPNVYKYNADPNGDFISTTEETVIAGDAVTVAKENITIEQGSTFTRVVVYKDADGNPVDLTGYTAEMQIRKTKTSSSVIITLSTSNGRLELGGVDGTITMIIAGAITNDLDFVWGRYDLELYPAGNTNIGIRLLEGKVNLSKQVTQ